VSIEVRHLRYFVAVAEELHFTRAAERLHLAQPALSLQIRRLERELGLRLFARNTRQVRLTKAGEQILERARAVLRDYDALTDLAGTVARGESGHLALGVSPQARTTVGAAIVTAIRERLPGVVLSKREEGTSPLVADVQAGRLDAALGFCPRATDELVSEQVRNEPLLVAVPAGHPLADRDELTIEELRDETWLLPSEAKAGGYLAVLRRWCATMGFQPRAADETTDYDEEFEPVRHGRGIEMVTVDFRGERQIDDVVFVPIALHQTLPMQLVWRGDNDNPVVPKLVEIVRDLRDANRWTASPTAISA
jgi:LysR family transcriptional regulator, benzoate and cis,cis-muconate-responsive activator of ben and cat genes